MQVFQPDRFYKPSDPEMRVIAAEGTLSQWRFRGHGPTYVKFGKRVVYPGAALNDYIAQQTVTPAAACA